MAIAPNRDASAITIATRRPPNAVSPRLLTIVVRTLNERMWKFLAVGLSGIGVNLGVLLLLTETLGAHAYAGWLAAVEASVLSNFWWNRTFTWRDRRANGIGGVTREGMRYHASSLAGIACNFVAFSAATFLLGAPPLVGALAGIGAGFAANFAGATRFVFPARNATTQPAPSPRLTLVTRDEPASAVPDRKVA